jgi:hypothetical protein
MAIVIDAANLQERRLSGVRIRNGGKIPFGVVHQFLRGAEKLSEKEVHLFRVGFSIERYKIFSNAFLIKFPVLSPLVSVGKQWGTMLRAQSE